MSFISFAHTTPALLAGRKTVTRREWTDRHAKQFHEGDIVDAYDKSPRNGGRKVARIRLTQKPYQERYCDVLAPDFESEGFAYIKEQGGKVLGKSVDDLWEAWRSEKSWCWVVRFELVP